MIDTVPILREPTINGSAMSATAIISTGTVDRDADLLEPSGIVLDNYRKNPVVLWEHGLGEVTIPIAKSEDPNGNLTVRVVGDTVEATSFFSNRSLVSEQIFQLIEDKIIRATSVQATPIDATPLRVDGLTGQHMHAWELVEWSWTGVGINPEAIAKTLGRNRLAGR